MAEAGLIFQRDGTILVTGGEHLDQVLHVVRQSAHLRAIVAGDHVYELSQPALWAAASRGVKASEMIGLLERRATMPLPAAMAARIAEEIGRYGAIEIVDGNNEIVITSRVPGLLNAIGLAADNTATRVEVGERDLARIRLAAVARGWPIVDRRSLVTGDRPFNLADHVRLRPYQADALRAYRAGRDGIVLLPCGAGKTMVGVAAAAAVGGPALVLVPSRMVGEQWRTAFIAETDCCDADVVWADTGSVGATITIATYQAATVGRTAGELVGRRWRLIVYDEVQSLPAAVFRLAAGIESDRRLGLSATLVREDGREAEVFALVGPPLYEASWLELEHEGWIAPARCVEVRMPAGDEGHGTLRHRMAVVQRLLAQHVDEQSIVIGTDVADLQAIGRRLDFPVLTGATPNATRANVFESFRSEAIRTVGVSRIGSVGIDLPNARVMVQVSGTYGSRQEEAQRLGRILRSGAGKTATFYTIVAAATREQHFAARRQRFLVNQGYRYEIVDASSLPRPPGDSM